MYSVTFCESRSFPYFHGKTWNVEAASELSVSTKLLLGIDFIWHKKINVKNQIALKASIEQNILFFSKE